MPEDFFFGEATKMIAQALGPAGFAFFISTCVLGYFYRRDVLRRQNESHNDFVRLLSVLEGNAQILERMTQQVSHVVTELQRHEDKEIQVIEGLGPKIEHAINSGVQSAMLTVLTQVRTQVRRQP